MRIRQSGISCAASWRRCGTSPKLSSAKSRPGRGRQSVAARLNGTTDWFAGNFADARVSLECALAIFDPERDSDLAFRFAQDLGVSITAYLALVLWPLGEVDRAREVAEEMVARATRIGHVGAAVYGISTSPCSR